MRNRCDRRRKKAVAKPSMSVLQREFDRMDEEYADDSEYDEATADALDSATRLFAEPTEQEDALLKQMKKWAERPVPSGTPRPSN